MNDVWELMAARRHTGLRRLVAPGPDEAALLRMMDAAAAAPDHGLLRPWRFVLIPPARRADLGAVFEAALLAKQPNADPEARAAAREKAQHAPCLLVAILVDTPGTAIPVEEKLVSLGCALQNVLLGAQAQGFASGLASGGALAAPGMRDLLGLAPHERALCFVGIGTPSKTKTPRERPQPGAFFSSL